MSGRTRSCGQPTTRIPTGSSPARLIWCGNGSRACRQRPSIRSWPAARWVSTVLARHPHSTQIRAFVFLNILRLPDLGASTGEAEVVVWLKATGDSVTAGEPGRGGEAEQTNVRGGGTVP